MKNKKRNRSEGFDPTLEYDVSGEEKDVWEAMHYDFEIVEEPSGLKEEVLNFVFEHEHPNGRQVKRNRSLFESIRAQFTPFTASLCTVMLICILVLTAPLIRSSTGVEFNEITASMTLVAAEGRSGEVYGHAFLMNKNGKEELVVNVYGFPQTEGPEVYQVWVIANGHRQSAGVFKSNQEGFGVLTVDMSKLHAFDNIGITLEPDATSEQPRGKKIVGTG